MTTASDRKNRRVPILSLLFILISTVLTFVCSILQTQIISVVQTVRNILGLIEIYRYYGSDLSVTFIILNYVLPIVYTFLSFLFSWILPLLSAAAFIAILILLLTKSKGGALAITSGVAVAGNVVKAIFCFLGGVFSFIMPYNTNLFALLSDIVSSARLFIFALCWLAFGIACLCSIFYHKSNKKGVKTTAKVLAIIFGIGGSSMFLVRIAGNIWSVISSLSTIIFNLLLGFTALPMIIFNLLGGYTVLGTLIISVPTFLITLFFAGIFIFANVLGFVGMILLITYLLNPYKKGKKDAEAVECECTDHTECECCGEEAEHECSCTDECTCEADADTIDPSPDAIVELPNA